MSPGTNQQRPPRITVVTTPGCHFCEDAHQVLTQLADGAAIELELVEATSPAGLALLAQHRPPMNPLVIVDGTYFSAGRLPRRKLQTLLASTSTRTGVMVARHG
jgi:glutaredoxin